MLYVGILAGYIAAGVVFTVLLFWCYVFVMGAKRVRDRKTLTPLAYYLSMPILALGMVVDVLVNQLYMSVVCLDFKRFGTVTSRVKQYKYGPAKPWQKAVSAWIEMQIDDFEDVAGGRI